MDVSKNSKATTTPATESEIQREMRLQMIEDHFCCVLCGSELKFTHQVNYAALAVIENASCPSCRIQLRAREHGLH